MVDFADMPPTLEAARIDDAVLAAAYEEVTPQDRAHLKTTQALVQWIHQEQPTEQHGFTASSTFGFSCAQHSRPVPWVIVLLTPDFSAAVRLSAALMLARLAGVNQIAAVFVDAPAPKHCTVSAALELAGVEHLLTGSADVAVELLRMATQQGGCGRVLTFGNQTSLRESIEVAQVLHIPLWSDTPPCLAVSNSDARATAQRAHPDAQFCDVSATFTCRADALIAAEGQPTAPGAAPLCLSADLGACWIHTNLLPTFFRNATLSVAVQYPNTLL